MFKTVRAAEMSNRQKRKSPLLHRLEAAT